jgi:hypothetical protein
VPETAIDEHCDAIGSEYYIRPAPDSWDDRAMKPIAKPEAAERSAELDLSLRISLSRPLHAG